MLIIVSQRTQSNSKPTFVVGHMSLSTISSTCNVFPTISPQMIIILL